MDTFAGIFIALYVYNEIKQSWFKLNYLGPLQLVCLTIEHQPLDAVQGGFHKVKLPDGSVCSPSPWSSGTLIQGDIFKTNDYFTGLLRCQLRSHSGEQREGQQTEPPRME